MRNVKLTIRKMMTALNNAEENGGFWLPNIQRPFVWSEEKICRLYDSIMRQYPISTLLVWNTKSDIKRRKFIDNYITGTKLLPYYVPQDNDKKKLVLDGQQRLQSLFIGLHGSYDGKELYFDMLSGENNEPDDIKYSFKFIKPDEAEFPWVKFKTLVAETRKNREIVSDISSKAGSSISQAILDKIADHIELIKLVFTSNDSLMFQELDSVDNPALYSDDDVVEVFIRANSGGTPLGKSDLLFSLLSASWDEAEENMADLLDKLNSHGFAFDRDFILKSSLVVLGKGAKYEISKFRKPETKEAVEKNWVKIAEAITDVLDFVRGKTYIHCDKALPSYNSLIPLVYLRYSFPQAWRDASDIEPFLLRALLAGAFSGHADNLIDALVAKIKDIKGFSKDEFNGVIRNQGRNLDLTEEKFLSIGYGSDAIHLLFNYWYRDFNHTPAYENNLPQVDHIFPQSALRSVKEINPETNRKVQSYRKPARDQLANCMLLSKQENGAGGKSDVLPEVWFDDKSNEYLEKHVIPKDKNLWKLERYDDFIAERKRLLLTKFSDLVQINTP